MSDIPRIVMTCSACPEQYDVFLGDQQIGYLRLRHGCFRADYPSCGGEVVYEASPNGDGEFDDDGERDRFIGAAIHALLNRHHGVPRPALPYSAYERAAS